MKQLWLLYNRFTSFRSFIRRKIIQFVDRTDLFKVSNLVYGGREIVMSLRSSLQGQRQFMAGIVS
jgi:hypothetical protein